MDLLNSKNHLKDPFNKFIGCNTGVDILSCSNLQIFQIVSFVFLCNIIALFGFMANIINAVIFFKQGFTNTVNISFFSLSISDTFCLITLLWVCMCLNPFINAAGVPWVPVDFTYLPGGWPHIVCGRITSYITVFITAERCLSIITPLKIKQIITLRRSVVVICLIYVINIVILVPEYATSYLQFIFFPEINATRISITFSSNRDLVTGFVYFMSSLVGISSFLSVIFWTVLLVVKLQQNSKWRKLTCNDREGIMSSREKKTIKMVAIIASILIVCYTPGTVASMATFIEPELNLGKSYMNVWIAIWSFAFVFQSVNSSVNIFLYYTMSSNYRRTFNEVFNNRCQIKKVNISENSQHMDNNLHCN